MEPIANCSSFVSDSFFALYSVEIQTLFDILPALIFARWPACACLAYMIMRTTQRSARASSFGQGSSPSAASFSIGELQLQAVKQRCLDLQFGRSRADSTSFNSCAVTLPHLQIQCSKVGNHLLCG